YSGLRRRLRRAPARAAVPFCRLGARDPRRHHLHRHAAGDLRNLHGGSTPADLTRVHDHRLRASQSRLQPRAPRLCDCAGPAAGHMVIRSPHVLHFDRPDRRGFATVLVLLLAIRVFEVQNMWSEASKTSVSFRDSVRLIDRGSKVLVAYADPDAGDDVKDLVLVHAACLAIIERSALVTTAFTVKGKQILDVREPY